MPLLRRRRRARDEDAVDAVVPDVAAAGADAMPEPPQAPPTATTRRRAALRGRVRRALRWPSRAVAGQLAVWLPAVAVSAIAFGTAGATYDVDRTTWGPMPFVGVVVGLPLVAIATRPVIGWLVSACAAFLLPVLLPAAPGVVWPWRWQVVHTLVLLALLLATAMREPLRIAVGAWLATVALFLWGTSRDIAAGWVVAVTAAAVVGWLVGRLVRTRRALSAQALATGAEQARRVVLEERQRIARDLHDVVAHHMSLVVVQAETAQYRVPDLGEGARAELAQIGESARAALSETRALLSVLREPDAGADLAPQPGVERVGELVDGARRAGLRVDADVRVVAPLRPGTSMTAYRVVQESLANAARHAPSSTVRLGLVTLDGRLVVSVVNSLGTDAAPEPVAGHGIVGMRERVGAVGGALTAGPRDGSFEVRADLPLDDVAAPA